MWDKYRVLGVDYADDVEVAYTRGELGDTPLIEEIIDNAVRAGINWVAWRVSHVGKLSYRTDCGTRIEGHRALRPSLSQFDLIFRRCDPLRVAVEAAHARGLKIAVYFTLFDEAYEGSESRFGREHPEFYLRHYAAESCVRGVMSFGYPEVREHFRSLVEEALGYGPDAVYLDLARTHAGGNPIPVHGWWPQWANPYLAYGYNEPDVERYRRRHGKEPPVTGVTEMGTLEPTQDEVNWNRCRGEAMCEFLREVAPLVKGRGAELHVCFYPATYNGFNPGYHCRQMLGRYHLDWPTWVEEGLVDVIRLCVDHRKFGYDDWMASSCDTYRAAQENGVRVLIDCAIEGSYDRLENPPAPLPISRRDDPDAYFGLMGQMVRKMLATGADGIFYYEHAAAAVREYDEQKGYARDGRTWDVLAAAHEPD